MLGLRAIGAKITGTTQNTIVTAPITVPTFTTYSGRVRLIKIKKVQFFIVESIMSLSDAAIIASVTKRVVSALNLSDDDTIAQVGFDNQQNGSGAPGLVFTTDSSYQRLTEVNLGEGYIVNTHELEFNVIATFTNTLLPSETKIWFEYIDVSAEEAIQYK